jgi:2-methylcitrate dehydratase
MCCGRRWSCAEDKRYSADYLDADKRSIANAVQVFFRDGSHTERVEVEYPIGHRRRRAEGIPELVRKARVALPAAVPDDQAAALVARFTDAEGLGRLSASDLLTLLVAG